jgi:hypothetical protein
VQRSYKADRLGCTCICFLIRLRIAFWRRFALSRGLVYISILDLVLPGKMDTRPGFCTPLQLIILIMVGDEIIRLETAYRESHAGSAYLGKLPSVPRFQDTKPTIMAHARLVDWWIGGLDAVARPSFACPRPCVAILLGAGSRAPKPEFVGSPNSPIRCPAKPSLCLGFKTGEPHMVGMRTAQLSHRCGRSEQFVWATGQPYEGEPQSLSIL